MMRLALALTTYRAHRRLAAAPSGEACPECGAELVWNRRRTTTSCRAPSPTDPLRTCGYSCRHQGGHRRGGR